MEDPLSEIGPNAYASLRYDKLQDGLSKGMNVSSALFDNMESSNDPLFALTINPTQYLFDASIATQEPMLYSSSAKSCLTCKSRRKRCDGMIPSCRMCLKVNMECSYGVDRLQHVSHVITGSNYQKLKDQAEHKANIPFHSEILHPHSRNITPSNSKVSPDIHLFSLLGSRGKTPPQIEYKYDEQGVIEKVEVIQKLEPDETYIDGIGVVKVLRAKVNSKFENGVLVYRDQ